MFPFTPHTTLRLNVSFGRFLFKGDPEPPLFVRYITRHCFREQKAYNFGNSKLLKARSVDLLTVILLGYVLGNDLGKDLENVGS
jgi:hypothetical protein